MMADGELAEQAAGAELDRPGAGAEPDGPGTGLVQVFADLVRYETRLYTALSERLRAGHGLTIGQFEFLRVIGDRNDCRVNDLAHDIAITVGATSKAVDRLEAAGWVRRRPNPANRRSSLLALTPAGRRLLEAAAPTVTAELRTWLAGPLTGRSLGQLATSLARLRQTMQDAGAGQPTG
jgi:MarR family transcriptional regulator, multiple antibiotic resistance protein MarR